MHQPRLIFSATTLSLIFIFFASTAFAQAEDKDGLEPSYEAVLQVVVGSNDAAQPGDLPKSLSGVSKQLRENFSFSNYRLANTLIGRLGNTGSLEYKSVSDIFGQGSESERPTFLEWTLGQFKSTANEQGKLTFQAQPFRFGAKVPVVTGRSKTAEGQAFDVVSYEHVGLSMNRVSFPGSKPTLIGTLSLPKTSGTVFLVLTVTPVEN
jgi:hypothetical protein